MLVQNAKEAKGLNVLQSSDCASLVLGAFGTQIGPR